MPNTPPLPPNQNPSALFAYARGVVDERHTLQHDVAQREFWLERLRLEFEDINSRCRDHEAHIKRLTSELDGILNSPAWKATFPLRYLGSRFGRGRAAPGIAAPEAPGEGGAPAEPQPPPLVLTPPANEVPPPTTASVSFIIPSYNGRDDLAQLLPLLQSQAGLGTVEIIVIDSGSTDGSAELAEAAGATVIRIPSSDFSHSGARNQAAGQAAGEYLCFLTQDALPTGPHWARRLLQPLLDGKAVAVSPREEPREDAGLYARVGIWHHNQYLGVADTDRVLALPEVDDYYTLRQNASLNNVACLIGRDVFLQYYFKGDYAEDLDLGIRLVRAGHPLALLASEQVIHSHSRPISYTLKRAAINERFFLARFPDYPRQDYPPDELPSRLVHGWRQACLLRDYLATLGDTALDADSLAYHMEIFSTALPLFDPAAQPDAPMPPSGDSAFDDFLNQLHTLYLDTTPAATGMGDDIYHYFRAILLPYLQAFPAAIGPAQRAEVIDCVFHYYAATLGVRLGVHSYLATTPDALTTLARPLAQGV
ncbi:MAG: glycosyltransferase [Ruminococcaceae bacterium]|nr:glycosyltransferase [Oscillospiraceae bacterium]